MTRGIQGTDHVWLVMMKAMRRLPLARHESHFLEGEPA
jgi:hypothetical protein